MRAPPARSISPPMTGTRWSSCAAVGKAGGSRLAEKLSSAGARLADGRYALSLDGARSHLLAARDGEALVLRLNGETLRLRLPDAAAARPRKPPAATGCWRRSRDR